ncbi:MAG TPA: hypothetical protein VFZ73_10610 [Gemmatimonadaceae bacterium]
MRATLTSLLLLGAACALNPAPVPVIGPVEEVGVLAGEWTGEYQSLETGRSGSILFMLDAGRDTAHGDIVMVARETNMTHDDALRVAAMRHAANQVLTIRFVRVDGDMVTGTIDPYRDPDVPCELLTVFRGTLSGDRISGTFRTRRMGYDGAISEGTWWVRRTTKK